MVVSNSDPYACIDAFVPVPHYVFELYVLLSCDRHQSGSGDVFVSAQAYAENGFTVLRGVFSGEQLAAMQDEVGEVATGRRGAVYGADSVRGDTDAETVAGVLAIHFPHKVSPLYREALAAPAVVDVLTEIIGPDVKCMQSMLFVKPPGKPGQPWHQDEHFIPTRDRSLTGVWIALDDADEENGCLWAIPGSHKAGIIWPMREQHEPGYDHNPVSFGFPENADDAVPIEVKAGDAIVFNGYVIHGSRRNGSATRSRRALVNHYMSARSLLPWGMLGAREDWRDIVMVAGEDPYAWKGTETLVHPFIRPEGPEAQAKLHAEMGEHSVFGDRK